MSPGVWVGEGGGAAAPRVLLATEPKGIATAGSGRDGGVVALPFPPPRWPGGAARVSGRRGRASTRASSARVRESASAARRRSSAPCAGGGMRRDHRCWRRGPRAAAVAWALTTPRWPGGAGRERNARGDYGQAPQFGAARWPRTVLRRRRCQQWPAAWQWLPALPSPRWPGANGGARSQACAALSPALWRTVLLIHAPGLTPAAVLEKLATIQMVEV